MAINSRNKGKKGELELASKFREQGYDARRSQQYAGINGDSDVVGLPGIHVECKRTEKLNLYDAIGQAKRDSHKTGEMPVVFHRRNNCEWLVMMTLENWFALYREWEASKAMISTKYNSAFELKGGEQ